MLILLNKFHIPKTSNLFIHSKFKTGYYKKHKIRIAQFTLKTK